MEDTFDKLEDDFLLAMNMPTVPNFCKVKPDHIFDEDRSVRWNREEAIRVNSEYDEKYKILRAKRNEAVSQVIDRIKSHIAKEVCCSINKASLIWNFAYDCYHSNDELFDKLEELEELFANYERID